MQRRDNYQIQAEQAKKLFLTYDQQELIQRCRLEFDERYFYVRFLNTPYRLNRQTGDLSCMRGGQWCDGNSFEEVMTLLDWLCDSHTDRFISGCWGNPHGFHRQLQEKDSHAALFDQYPEAFEKACAALGGQKMTGADICYAIEILDGLSVRLQLWRSDEEFPAQLRCLWDKNMTMYLRYETSWYALGMLLRRLREEMADVQ